MISHYLLQEVPNLLQFGDRLFRLVGRNDALVKFSLGVGISALLEALELSGSSGIPYCGSLCAVRLGGSVRLWRGLAGVPDLFLLVGTVVVGDRR